MTTERTLLTVADTIDPDGPDLQLIEQDGELCIVMSTDWAAKNGYEVGDEMDFEVVGEQILMINLSLKDRQLDALTWEGEGGQ
jgi:hypothetical protein